MANPVGTAYIQIMPVAKGVQGQITNAISPGVAGASDTAGKKGGAALIKGMAGVLAAAGASKLIANSLFAGADLQQSIGGIETLYKDSADKMMEYANQAYKTTGLSANDYMQSVTSYSAALISGYGGDVDKAADAANQAMIDMADNANKMGTPIENIQAAYMSFSRGQYQLLDNLKIGYGGTRSEMLRLLDDAEKITGVKYDINNLGDVYDAIHVIQTEIGITGTTQKEAADTISGSISMMKAAYGDLIANLALGNDIYPQMVNLFSSIITVAKNVLPAIASILTGIPRMIIDHWPDIVKAVQTAGQNVMAKLKENGPTWLQAAVDAVSNFASGIISAIPQLLSKVAEVIGQVVQYIKDHAPEIMAAAGTVLANVGKAIIKALPGVIKGIFNLAVSTVKASFTLVKTAISGAISGIKSMIKTALSGTALGKLVADVKDAISKPFRDAKDKISEVIGKIKGFFPLRLGKIFDGLQLPHFKIDGGKIPWGVGGKGTAPSVAVEWYRKAEDNPYMFRNATLFGAGEHGDEILYGRASLLRDIAQVVGNDNITINVYAADGMSVDQLAAKVESKLIAALKREAAAWA